MISRPCPKCKGRGIIRENRDVSVKIPAGIDSGMRLRLRGEGEPGRFGGPDGDLYVVVDVEPDKIFQRDGQNLLISREISMVQAALGCTIDIPSLDGDIPLTIPKGTQSGTVIRQAGKGLPYINRRQTGDLLVTITVRTPTGLSDEQEELLRRFDELSENNLVGKLKKGARRISEAMGLK